MSATIKEGQRVKVVNRGFLRTTILAEGIVKKIDGFGVVVTIKKTFDNYIKVGKEIDLDLSQIEK
jgi:hypothetical protein